MRFFILLIKKRINLFYCLVKATLDGFLEDLNVLILPFCSLFGCLGNFINLLFLWLGLGLYLRLVKFIEIRRNINYEIKVVILSISNKFY